MGNRINPISFMDIEKISDIICYLSRDVNVKFNVVLARKKEDGTRNFFHKEYEYNSKYLDVDKSITISRSFDYYITLDFKDNFEAGVMIRPKDMMNLQLKLNDSIRWFGKLFKTDKEGNLIIFGDFKKIYIKNLAGNKYLCLEPTIIKYEDNTSKEGIRVFFSSTEVYTDIDIDNYMGFVYLMNKIDLYGAAITLLNYLNVDYGQNLSTFENSRNVSNYDPYNGESSIGKGTSFKNGSDRYNNRVGKSFFDRVTDELE